MHYNLDVVTMLSINKLLPIVLQLSLMGATAQRLFMAIYRAVIHVTPTVIHLSVPGRSYRDSKT